MRLDVVGFHEYHASLIPTQPCSVACRWQAKVFWCKDISTSLISGLNNKGGMYMVEDVVFLDHFVPICCWYVLQKSVKHWHGCQSCCNPSSTLHAYLICWIYLRNVFALLMCLLAQVLCARDLPHSSHHPRSIPQHLAFLFWVKSIKAAFRSQRGGGQIPRG